MKITSLLAFLSLVLSIVQAQYRSDFNRYCSDILYRCEDPLLQDSCFTCFLYSTPGECGQYLLCVRYVIIAIFWNDETRLVQPKSRSSRLLYQRYWSQSSV